MNVFVSHLYQNVFVLLYHDFIPAAPRFFSRLYDNGI